MQRVKSEYADRVSTILNKAIQSLKNQLSDEALEVAKILKALLSTTLSVLFEDESLCSDIHKLECELNTKNDELCKLRAKLCTMRESRRERRAELDAEILLLRTLLNEKEVEMRREQDLSEEHEILTLGLQRTSFEREVEDLIKRKEELLKQNADLKSLYTLKDSNLRANIIALKTEIQKLNNSYEEVSRDKMANIEAIREELERQKDEQRKLEKHFRMIDLNNEIRQQEEEQLKKVAELERMAMMLLDDGALALQKVWRGMKDRKLVLSMKSSKPSKKGGKSKKTK